MNQLKPTKLAPYKITSIVLLILWFFCSIAQTIIQIMDYTHIMHKLHPSLLLNLFTTTLFGVCLLLGYIFCYKKGKSTVFLGVIFFVMTLETVVNFCVYGTSLLEYFFNNAVYLPTIFWISQFGGNFVTPIVYALTTATISISCLSKMRFAKIALVMQIVSIAATAVFVILTFFYYTNQILWYGFSLVSIKEIVKIALSLINAPMLKVSVLLFLVYRIKAEKSEQETAI